VASYRPPSLSIFFIFVVGLACPPTGAVLILQVGMSGDEIAVPTLIPTVRRGTSRAPANLLFSASLLLLCVLYKSFSLESYIRSATKPRGICMHARPATHYPHTRPGCRPRHACRFIESTPCSFVSKGRLLKLVGG